MSDPKDVLARFRSPDAASDLAGRLFDHAMAQRVDRFIDPEAVLPYVDAAITAASTERALKVHLRAWVDREAKRARERDDRVGDWLTDDAKKTIREVLGRPVELDRRFLKGLVQQDAVKQMTRGMVEATMSQFLESIKSGDGGGLFGKAGRGALGFATKGPLKKVMGQIEAQLQKAAGVFAASSMSWTLSRMVDLLASPDMAKQLARMNQAGFDEAQKLKTGFIYKAMLTLPLDDLLAIGPPLLAHNLARSEIRAGLREEVQAWLQIEGGRTVGELLAEGGSLEYWRDAATRDGGALLAEFAATDAFAMWLEP